MKKSNLNTALLLMCTVLLVVCAVGIFTRPTLEEIDERMMMWGQHYGTHFSEVNKQGEVKVATTEAGEESAATE